MDAPGVLATVEDYASRYGRPSDEEAARAFLSDASALVLAEYENHHGKAYARGDSPAFDRAAPGVVCQLARRALSVPAGFDGVQSVSQGALGFSASLSYGQGGGSMYLTRAMKGALGLNRQQMGAMHPIERGVVPDGWE